MELAVDVTQTVEATEAVDGRWMEVISELAPDVELAEDWVAAVSVRACVIVVKTISLRTCFTQHTNQPLMHL